MIAAAKGTAVKARTRQDIEAQTRELGAWAIDDIDGIIVEHNGYITIVGRDRVI